MTAFQENDSCYGSSLVPFRVPRPTWSSANTRIATINRSGVTTGRRGGSTTLTAAWTAYGYYLQPGDELTGEGGTCLLFTTAPRPQTPEKVLVPDNLEILLDRYVRNAGRRYQRDRVYQIRDGREPIRKAGMLVTESFRNWSSNACELPPTRDIQQGGRRSAGSFVDRFCLGAQLH